MLFDQLIKAGHSRFEKATEQLFELAYSNQQDPQEMLLVVNHAFYDKQLEGNRLNLSPYVIGPGSQGHAYYASYSYIDNYRQKSVFDLDVFEKQLNSTDKEIKNKAEEFELMSLHLEHFIYLKFWESDFLIKQLYQITRLVNKDSYDWRYEVPEIGRHKTIRKDIRDRLRTTNPDFADIIAETYKPQIRNAIAHSQFYFIGRSMHFMNYGLNPGDDIKFITFEQWRPYIHNTILLFNELIDQREKFNLRYGGHALKNSNKLDIQVTKPTEIKERRALKYYPENNRWGF